MHSEKHTSDKHNDNEFRFPLNLTYLNMVFQLENFANSSVLICMFYFVLKYNFINYNRFFCHVLNSFS